MSEMNFEMLNDFVGDPIFEKLKNWDRSVNCYEVTGIDETKHSRFISWLLNPREGHGLGDLFIKELLLTCMRTHQNMNGGENQKWKHIIDKNEFFKNKTILDIQEMSFQDAIFEVEFPAGVATSVNGRRPAVDICVFDYKNSLMIVIENKHGSKEKPKNQTKEYRNYLHKRFDSAFDNLVYIYIDYDERTPSDLNWIGLGYEWIIEFCRNVIDQNLCSQRSYRIIEDYYKYLLEDDTRNLEIRSGDDWLLNLANNHKDFIDLLLGKNWGNSHLYCSNEEMAKKISRAKKNKEKVLDSLEFKLWHLYQKHWGIIDYLSKSANLELIKNCLAERLNLEKDYTDSESRWVACADPALIERYAKDSSNYWPICVYYYLPKFKKNEHSDMQLERPGRICIGINKSNLKTEESDKVRQIIDNRKIWKKNFPELFVNEYYKELDRETAIKNIAAEFQKMQRLFGSQAHKPNKFAEIQDRLKGKAIGVRPTQLTIKQSALQNFKGSGTLLNN